MNKSKSDFVNVDEYIQSFPKGVQLKLEELRKIIKEEIPGAEETISYKMPTYKLNGKYVVYFAGWKNHISIYPISSAMEKSIKGLLEYKISGKGTIQFPNDKLLPSSLIRQIVSFLLKAREMERSE